MPGTNNMNIRGIKNELLMLLLELGRGSHPNEFVALLREKNGIIEELNMVPGTITGVHTATRTGCCGRQMRMCISFPGPGGFTLSSVTLIALVTGSVSVRTGSLASSRCLHEHPQGCCHRHV
jgi:hypothetical protein